MQRSREGFRVTREGSQCAKEQCKSKAKQLLFVNAGWVCGSYAADVAAALLLVPSELLLSTHSPTSEG